MENLLCKNILTKLRNQHHGDCGFGYILWWHWNSYINISLLLSFERDESRNNINIVNSSWTWWYCWYFLMGFKEVKKNPINVRWKSKKNYGSNDCCIIYGQISRVTRGTDYRMPPFIRIHLWFNVCAWNWMRNIRRRWMDPKMYGLSFLDVFFPYAYNIYFHNIWWQE